MTKQEARRLVKKYRAALSEIEAAFASNKICGHILAASVYREAEQVFCYAALPGEVQMASLMEQTLADGKILALPRVMGEKMTFYQINHFSDLCTGYRGIAEPSTACTPALPNPKTLLIMPGLAFDRQRHRVGYGGGYYDRYMEEHGDSFLWKIAPAYDFQIFDSLETESFDRRPDAIITTGGILDVF